MISPRIAIVDYGLGNLFSVKHACEYVGLRATITSQASEILLADAIILPGVGAFGNAMEALKNLDLVMPIKDAVAADKPIMGICLGLQLLMSESHEFGFHRGLDLIKGSVVKFDRPVEDGKELKVPHVGWSKIYQQGQWGDSSLAGVKKNAYMYFVHSYYAVPQDASRVLSTTRYGSVEFCSAIGVGNVFACQFHPERSGQEGLNVYRQWANQLRTIISYKEKENG